MPALTLEVLSDAVRNAAAVRANLRLQPAGGPGTKVFPPTYVTEDRNRDYEGTRYAMEERRIDGEDVPCVLLDSVASQANRMEEALLDAWDNGDLDFPVVFTDFAEADGQLEAKVGRITTLEAPHRIYDAIFRDSVDEGGTLFRYTDIGQQITHATRRDASALFTYCPTALVFGCWDSTGPKGGLGSKFPRALSSEIVAVGAKAGTKVGGRLDPLGIVKKAGPLHEVDGPERWAMDGKGKGKLNPSDINHGNVAPSRSKENGGITFDYAQQTTVLSLPALRRLRFGSDASGAPVADRAKANEAARTALAALAVAGIVTAYEEGHDLRSGTLLVGDQALELEIVGAAGESLGAFTLDADGAAALVAAAAQQAAAVGLPWQRNPMTLKPAPKLVALLKKSQQLEATTPADEEG